MNIGDYNQTVVVNSRDGYGLPVLFILIKLIIGSVFCLFFLFILI
ncbi:MAG: hypothetical protein OFPI_39690 [Osedax symbiont Rs2]|nr:MAG: hypothetical protein OFPI_39690 [Osedax symbiont Rs2]